MTKRRTLVKELKEAGFKSQGGTNHEKFIHSDGRSTVVPRHREIPNRMASIIRRQAGIE